MNELETVTTQLITLFKSGKATWTTSALALVGTLDDVGFREVYGRLSSAFMCLLCNAAMGVREFSLYFGTVTIDVSKFEEEMLPLSALLHVLDAEAPKRGLTLRGLSIEPGDAGYLGSDLEEDEEPQTAVETVN